MKRAAGAATAGTLLLALWWPSPLAAAAAPPPAKRLEDLLPPRLGGAALTLSSAPERAVGHYQLRGEADGDTRYVAITLILAPDAIEIRDATVVRKRGEIIAFDGDIYEGLQLSGRLVQRACATDGSECRVDMLLAKRLLLLSVRVERPPQRSEPLGLLEHIDIKGLEAFARKQRQPRAPRSPDVGATRVRKEEAKLAEILRSEPREGLKTLARAAGGLPSAAEPTAAPPPAESLTGDQIKRGLGARSLGVRACYEVAVAENPLLPGGEMTVSFTVEPSGSIAVPKVEDTTIADQAVEACVLRHLQKCSFAAARAATSARHTFVFSPAAPLRPDRRAPAPLPAP